jgi:uncharacterized protein YdeI (YjbR/CyaY-like superfamily)
MPAYVVQALAERRLTSAYRQRPAYQKNDYLAWIKPAKQDPTRRRRLAQMLEELEQGDRYMKMAWRPSAARPVSGRRMKPRSGR